MSEEKKSPEERMVAMFDDLIESSPGEGRAERVAYVVTGLLLGSKLSFQDFVGVVSFAVARTQNVQQEQATKSAQKQAENN